MTDDISLFRIAFIWGLFGVGGAMLGGMILNALIDYSVL